MPLNEEDRLMMQAASNDINAFESLVRRYQNKAIKFCYGQLNDYHLAEEVSQEAFLRLYKSVAHYKPEGNLSGFFYKIMLNLCRNAYKSASGNHADYDELIKTNKSEGVSPFQTLESKESQMAVRAAIDKLPAGYKEIIILREFEELKYNDIAKLLQVSLDEVKIRLYRARKRLGELLKVTISQE
jgi:RNA polymerase sigma factor (sigma-70 family)